jgi:DNA helicase-2/ATP-dependent DNA helicase PcrA
VSAAAKKRFVLAPRERAVKLAVDYAEALNAEQLAAAQAPPGPVLVIAGAGTGKTRVITYRVAYLLETGARPTEVMLLTFTNKAAREMMSRVEGLVGSSVHEIWGGTFHHIAHRILRKHADRLGYRPGYTILDREDSRSLMRACIAERPGARGGRRKKGASRSNEKRFPQAQVLESIHSLAVNTQTHAGEIIGTRYTHFADRTDQILEVLRVYEERKRAANAMSYDDLLWNWLRLMEDEEFRSGLRARFRHVLVDEYQDTNRLQGEVVDHMCAPAGSLTVVGDDAQAIYAWRGATPENMLSFPERYPGARVVKLETNYRSTPEVLEVANRAIRANPRKFEKELHPLRESGPRPEVVPCRDAFQQSRFVTERIIQMHEAGTPLENISVLYRSHWNALELQLELQRRDVPFRVRGGIRFFEQAHIKDTVAFLRAVENPRDELAWLRALPLIPNVGPATTRAIVMTLEALPDPIKALSGPDVLEVVPSRAQKPFKRFAKLLGKLAEPDIRRAPSEMIRLVLTRFYSDYLATRYPNASAREEDLAQLALYAAQYESAEAFISDLALSGVVEAETSPVGPDEDRYVTLSTVHQAKGLEWPVVFVIWLADGRFPTDFAGKVEGGYDEERRLFHVALTRAKDELVLAYPMTYRWRGMEPVLMKRSRFLVELDDPHPEPYDIVEIEEPLPSDFMILPASDVPPALGAAPAQPALPAPTPAPAPKAKAKRKAKKKAGRKRAAKRAAKKSVKKERAKKKAKPKAARRKRSPKEER